MSLDNVTPGNKVPESFNVIIEIPMNADPVKYEVDKATGCHLCGPFHEYGHALPHQLRLRAQDHLLVTATRWTCW